MKKLIIKVCGMRDTENIDQLQALEVDWMGFIFFKKSPRNVEQPIFNKKIKTRVGVFVNETFENIIEKARSYQLDIIQLHGEENPDFCQALKEEKLQVIKVFSVGQSFDFSKLKPYEAHCDYFLFDTKGKARGGNGVAFDWSILKNYHGKTPFLLSGGIHENSAIAIKALDFPQMVGIDINSRFELEPAFKNIQKIERFIQEIKL